jgi:nitrite reductase/ring-hydroxylating ferredoxin subunit
MLSREDNELLTRTDAGTPMGETLRRYWIPALLCSELPDPDGEPVRVKLLGEQLVAFRDTSGRVGLVDEFCPHRAASLWFGRNEDNGLRCVFHGWKFDVEGNCLDQMNEPEELQFCHKVRLKAYPTVETGGVVWAYMGPRDKRPELPKFEWACVPDSHREISKTWEECNWLQALEGGIDTSHAPILHRNIRLDPENYGIGLDTLRIRGKAPRLEVDVQDYGYVYAGLRDQPDGNVYVRAYHYVMPWTQIRAHQIQGGGYQEFLPLVRGHMWVPMDDENCMVYNWIYSFGQEPLTDTARALEAGSGREVQANFRKVANRDNNYFFDRQRQRTQNFSGIVGVNIQDHAIQESMGPIVDRSHEHLGPADKAVITARRLLLDAVRTVQNGGDPPGLGPSYHTIRAIERLLPPDVSWREELAAELWRQATWQELAGSSR